MGIARIVNTDFWTDEDVLDYYSPEDKYFFLYLLTNPQTRQLGIYKLPKKIISFQTGYTAEAVAILLDRFQNKYKVIIYDHNTQEIAILNYLAYSVVRGGKPVMDCVEKDISLVKNKELIGMAYRQVKDKEVKDGVKRVIELLSVYNDNDIDNDIDNDSIVPRIVPRIVKDKPIKHKYGEYKNVLLSDEQMEKLKTEFPDYEERIERVSEYCASTGKSYKDYLATIRAWAKKEKKQSNTDAGLSFKEMIDRGDFD